ncbi:MAG: site-2 protease family protein [Patescibacteria group bacterium]
MDLIIAIFSLIVLLFSVIIHELAHGYVAYSLGDPTAKYEGRLTLNPLKHLDFFGSIILPLLLFISQSPILVGWAKPVPVNPYNFKDQKWGTLKVSIAGPATNFLIAIIFSIFVRLLNAQQQLFFISPQQAAFFTELLGIVAIYNFLWGLFNLVPIPPLDGSWILFRFLPQRFEKFKMFIQQYGLFILIFFIFFGGLSGLSFIAQLFYSLIVGTPLGLL